MLLIFYNREIRSCQKCSKSSLGAYQVKGTEERAKEAFERGFILLDDEVGGSYDELAYICEAGLHIRLSAPSNFRKLNECPSCLKVKTRTDKVRQNAKKKGFALETPELPNVNDAALFKCLKCKKPRRVRPSLLKRCCA
jgi:hypothetical protein